MTTSLVDEDEGIALRLIGLVVVLVLGVALGLGIYKSRPAKPAKAAPVLVVEEELAAIVIDRGVVKFFFTTASAELAGGANDALADIVKAVAAGKIVVISGYRDATGDALLNAELAKRRALAVRAALLGLGVGEASIELEKPALSTGTGTAREARRVEVLTR